MSDIVKRLRNPIRIMTDYGLELDRREAADEIDRLRSRLAEAERDAARYRFITNLCEVTYLGIEVESDSHLDELMAPIMADSADEVQE